MGLDGVKEVIAGLAYRIQHRQRRRSDANVVAPHLLFLGPPGTGKTTVARLTGEIFRSLGVLRGGQVVEVSRAELVGRYLGETAIKTSAVIEKAREGVLFIDEAYSLIREESDGRDFGREAVDTLVQAMENLRGKLVVIAAGYPDEMERFVRANPGLPARFTERVVFGGYSDRDLTEILRRTGARQGFELSPEVLDRAGRWFAARRRREPRTFGNAREARLLLERMETSLARRVSGEPDNAPGLVTFRPEDVPDDGSVTPSPLGRGVPQDRVLTVVTRLDSGQRVPQRAIHLGKLGGHGVQHRPQSSGRGPVRPPVAIRRQHGGQRAFRLGVGGELPEPGGALGFQLGQALLRAGQLLPRGGQAFLLGAGPFFLLGQGRTHLTGLGQGLAGPGRQQRPALPGQGDQFAGAGGEGLLRGAGPLPQQHQPLLDHLALIGQLVQGGNEPLAPPQLVHLLAQADQLVQPVLGRLLPGLGQLQLAAGGPDLIGQRRLLRGLGRQPGLHRLSRGRHGQQPGHDRRQIVELAEGVVEQNDRLHRAERSPAIGGDRPLDLLPQRRRRSAQGRQRSLAIVDIHSNPPSRDRLSVRTGRRQPPGEQKVSHGTADQFSQ